MRQTMPFALVAASLLWACGKDDVTNPPLNVAFGETTLVVVVNPVVNTDNQGTLPNPGTTRSGISVVADGGTPVVSGTDGVAVLAPIVPGVRSLSIAGGGMSGQVGVSIAEGDLREIAISLTNTGAAVMAEVRYAFGGEVVEITPSMSLGEVNAQLARSNIIVFLRSGIYRGDLRFSGSNVTLFGEGPMGGKVTIEGDVTVDGSNNRIRGARITGNLSVPGSAAGISFSRVAGLLDVAGSSAVLLNNAFCGGAALSGSNPTLLGNAGLDPVAAPSSGC